MDKWYKQNKNERAGTEQNGSRPQQEEGGRSAAKTALIVFSILIAIVLFFLFGLPALFVGFHIFGMEWSSKSTPYVDTRSDNPGSGMGGPLDDLVRSGDVPEPEIDSTSKVLEIKDLNTRDSLLVAIDAVNKTKSQDWNYGFVSGEIADNEWVFPHTMRARTAETFLDAQPAFDAIQLQPKDPDPFAAFTATCTTGISLEMCIEDVVPRAADLITELPNRNAMWHDVTVDIAHPDGGGVSLRVTDQQGPASTSAAMRRLANVVDVSQPNTHADVELFQNNVTVNEGALDYTRLEEFRWKVR